MKTLPFRGCSAATRRKRVRFPPGEQPCTFLCQPQRSSSLQINMSSSRDPSSNKKGYNVLQNEQPAPDAMSLDTSSGQSPTVNPPAEGQIRASSNKRPARPLLRYSEEDANKRIKLTEEALAAKETSIAPPVSSPFMSSPLIPLVSQSVTMRPAGETSYEATNLSSSRNFPFEDIPVKSRRQRCAFALLDPLQQVKSLGGIIASPVNWTTSVLIHAGHKKAPEISLKVRVANEPSLGELKALPGNYDCWELTWYAATSNQDGRLMIESFEYQTFTEWYQANEVQANEEPFMAEPKLQSYSHHCWTSRGEFSSPIVKNFDRPEISKSRLPPRVIQGFEALISGKEAVQFWCRPAKYHEFRVNLPLFARRVAENIGHLA